MRYFFAYFVSAVVASLVVTLPSARAGRDLEAYFWYRQSLSEKVEHSCLIYVARVEKLSKSSVDFSVIEILKGDKKLLGDKPIRCSFPLFSLYCGINEDKDARYVIFDREWRGAGGGLDFYGALEGKSTPSFVKDALKLLSGDRHTLLEFCGKHLSSEDKAIAREIDLEFKASTSKDIAAASRKLNLGELRNVVKNEKLPLSNQDLACMLLAYHGNAGDVDLVTAAAKRLAKEKLGEKALIGAVLLSPKKDGWQLLCDMLHDRERDFSNRYNAILAIRYLFPEPPEGLTKKDIAIAMDKGLEQADIADFLVEDLRRWRVWDHTDHILALAKKKSHEHPVIRRATVRYALDCPQKAAHAYIAEFRRRNPSFVADVEENLENARKFEQHDQK
ncbi:MAG: hypothetical protein HY040_24620 [Planctomycetes bacterium]|nr:hypothetical protein [Planctomycetota bacterium]